MKQPGGARRWRQLPRVRARDGLTLRVKLRGGAEGWIEVHARGSMGRFTGDTAIYDVLMEIADGVEYWRRS